MDSCTVGEVQEVVRIERYRLTVQGRSGLHCAFVLVFRVLRLGLCCRVPRATSPPPFAARQSLQSATRGRWVLSPLTAHKALAKMAVTAL